MAVETVGIAPIVEGANKYLQDVRKLNKAHDDLTKGINVTVDGVQKLGVKWDKTLRRFTDARGVIQKTTTGLEAHSKSISKAITAGQNLANTEKGLNDMLAVHGQLTKKAAEAELRHAAALEKLQEKVKGTRSQFTLFQQTVQRGGGGGGNFQQFAQSISPIQTLSKVLGRAGLLGALGAVAGAVGTAVVAFKSLVPIIGDISRTAADAAIRLQNLEIQFEGLLAREYRAADASLSVSDAFDKASTEAQKYLEWVKQLALTSPFDVDAITDTFVLGQAYGFTAEEARTLTVATLQFSAGMGLTNQQMERIIFNFGQMVAAGKLTGTELRDLARGAFLPVTKILRSMAEEMGVADENFEQFVQGAKEGSLDVKEFFETFIKVTGEDFPAAIERMSQTMEGSRTRLRNFFKIVVGMEVLGPVFDRLSLSFANFLNVLNSEQTYQSARQIGVGLSIVYDQISEAINNNLKPALKGLAEAFGFTAPSIERVLGLMSAFGIVASQVINVISKWAKTLTEKLNTALGDSADNAFEWGMNIVFELAQGIITGTSSFLTSAMNWISNALATWLKPGSPPKVAPEIDKWGSLAFTEYLRGMAKADFSVLSDIQNPLSSALSALVSLGDISQEQSGSLFKGISEGLAGALAAFREGGALPDIGGLFKDVIGATGRFGIELQSLAQKQFILLDITRKLEEAEKALKAARDSQKDAIDTVDELKKEYNELLRAGADPAILEQKLAEINASEEERDAAIEATKAAEDRVEALEGQVDPIQEAVQAQKELIDQMLKMLNVQKKLAASAGGGKGGGFDFAGAGGGAFPTLPELPDIEELGEEFKTKFKELGQEIIDGWKQTFADLGFDFGGMSESFTELSETLAEKWELIKPELEEVWVIIQGIWGTIQEISLDVWNAFNETLGESWQRLTDVWNRVTDNADIFDVWKGALIAVGAIFGVVALVISGLITGIVNGFLWLVEVVLAVVVPFWTMFWEGLKETFENWGTGFWGWLGSLLELVGEIFLGIVLIIGSALAAAGAFIWGFIEGVIEFFKNLWYELVGGSIIPDMFAQILDVIVTWVTDAITTISGWVTDMITWFTSVKDSVVQIVLDMITGVVDYFATLPGNVALKISLVITKIKTYASKFLAAGKSLVGGLWNGMKEKFETLKSKFMDMVKNLIDKVKNLLGISSPSKVFEDIGENTMSGFEKGMQKMAPNVIGSAAGVIGATTRVAAPVASTIRNSSVSVNVGNINSGMDAALLEATIRRIVLEEL